MADTITVGQMRERKLRAGEMRAYSSPRLIVGPRILAAAGLEPGDELRVRVTDGRIELARGQRKKSPGRSKKT